MRIGQGIDTALEHGDEVVHRFGCVASSMRDGGNARQSILHAMIELGDQEGLVVLGLSAFGGIDVDADHATGAPGIVIANAGSGFDPPHLAAWSDNAKLVNTLGLTFFESAAAVGIDPDHIIRMHTCMPVVGGDLGRALR